MLTPDEIKAMKERDSDLHPTLPWGRDEIDRHKLLLDREELQAEVERLKATVRDLNLDYHRVLTETWKALGIEEYTNKAAWEHVAEQKRELDSLRRDKERLENLLVVSRAFRSYLLHKQIIAELQSQLTASQARVKELEGQRDAAQSYLGELSSRMPTTANIMVWFSAKDELRKKLIYIAAECDEQVHATAAKEALSLLESKSLFHPKSIDAGLFSRITALENALREAKVTISRTISALSNGAGMGHEIVRLQEALQTLSALNSEKGKE